MESRTGNTIITNFIWRFAERCGAQLVQFIVSIVLARLLAPEVYGTIALITVITTILNVFVDSGMGSALIQKKDADSEDFSTVFYFNMCVCIILYIGLFISSPWIAQFYKDPTLTPVIRVLGLTIVISGVKNIQQAYISKTMQFKRFFFATLGGTIGAAVIGIWMAFEGFGVWALVAQQIFNATVDTMILWITVKWRPKKEFSFERLKGLFSYGWKLLASSLLDTVYNNIRQLIIGRMYTPSDLAFYNRGKQFPDVIITNINTTIDSVLLPTMSQEQDNTERVKAMTRRAIKTSTYIMAPLMMGLAFCAKSVISLILTDKWLACVPYMQIFCITSMFYPVHTANLNAIKAMGRSDLFLKLEIVKKVVGMVLLLSTMWFGVMAMAYSLLVSSVLSQIINSWPNRKLLGYGYLEQIRDFAPGILLAVGMGISVYFIGFIPLPAGISLMIQIVAGAIIYVSMSALLKLEEFDYLLGMIKSFLKK
ncbi:lipopolysaccharide biosynthesis protein [Holdemanella biformis]|uniref:lipopolysaccharide biosynthesis protein n=1 Tax=Holdemanella biformis TaxID=1735 RepID=UPI0025879D2E|nr:lipopolysaccharide biosynthesis protein [Holdemanella biformis]